MWDRFTRALVGASMLGAGAVELLPEPWDTGLEVLALGILSTAVLGWCPFYALRGRGTRGGPR